MPLRMEGLAPLLQVYDMPTSVRFYRDVLGFLLTQHSEPLDADPLNFYWCMLERDGATLMLNTAYEQPDRPPQPDPKRIAAHEDTSLFFGCPDPEEAYQHVQAHGYPADKPKVAPYGMKQLNLKDPDGYGICLQWPSDQCL